VTFEPLKVGTFWYIQQYFCDFEIDTNREYTTVPMINHAIHFCENARAKCAEDETKDRERYRSRYEPRPLMNSPRQNRKKPKSSTPNH
jgi:hypothetical protein